MRIFGWLADQSGCGWYRLVLPLNAIRQYGVETRWSKKLAEEDWEADIIVAQRTCLPGPTGIIQRLVRHKGKRPMLVFELDDDLWNIRPDNRASEFYTTPGVRENLTKNVQVADLVTVSTEPLAEVVRRWNSNVVVLPNAIPEELLAWESGYYTDRTTVGWQGSPTHDGDWRGAAEPVRRWFDAARKAETRVEMHTIGEIPTSFPQVFPHRHTQWQSVMAAYYRVLDWHVALAPLAASRFNQSKSWLRALEAAALGFPVIASDVLAYRDFVRDGETGLLVRRASDWGKHLTTLVNDPDLRAEMGRQARLLAKDHTAEGRAHEWLVAYGAELTVG